MNLLNRDTDYAVRALRYLAQRPGMVLSVAELHDELEVPQPYLRSILQKLARGGILRSHRGQHGGFQLEKRPEAVRLTDVMELFQGEVSLISCMLHGEVCPDHATCPLRTTIEEIEALVSAKLGAVTLATLEARS